MANMHRARYLIATFLFATFLLVWVRDARAEFRVGPSINIALWFTWPRYEPAPSTSIAWPPYKETPRPPSLAELQALKKAGFETIRLPVDPAPFIVFEGERRDAVYKMLFDAVALIQQAGLRVIVDLHPNSRHPVWGQHAVIAGLDAPAFTAFADVTAEMARRLKKLDQDRVALELMNEPRLQCKGEQQERWERIAGTLIKRARDQAPKLTLIVTGACVSSLDGMIALDPASLNDANLIYTFHFYEPFSFTHQGATFIPWPDKYLDGVPWPVHHRPIEEPLARLQVRMTKVNLDPVALEKARVGAQANLTKLYASGAGPETLDARFSKAADWAREHNIPPRRILVGEFGVLRKNGDNPGALCEDRIRWLTDIREIMEKHGFSWSYFAYDGPFALVRSDQDREFDLSVLKALGLRNGRAGCEG
jgi:endoglucanase